MKILYLNHNLRGRGTWFRCWHFARHLVRMGNEVTIWTASAEVRRSSRREILEGVEIIETPRFLAGGSHDGGWAPADITWRLFESTKQKYDLVQAFDHRPSVSLPWLIHLRRRETKAFADWADWWGRGGILSGRRSLKWLEDAEAMWEEKTKRMAAGVTCISRVLLERARVLGIPESRLAWIPSGADTERFRPLPKDECRRMFDLPLGAPNIGFAGFQLWDLELLFNAFEIVLRSAPDALLWIAGPAEGLLVRDNLRQSIRFAGTLPYDRMPEALCAADVLALPMEDNNANRGRLPGKLAEYLACGRPVVTQDVGDTGTIIQESGGGALTAGTAESFAEGIVKMLESGKESGEAGRRYAVEHLEWMKLAKAMQAFYQESDISGVT